MRYPYNLQPEKDIDSYSFFIASNKLYEFSNSWYTISNVYFALYINAINPFYFINFTFDNKFMLNENDL